MAALVEVQPQDLREEANGTRYHASLELRAGCPSYRIKVERIQDDSKIEGTSRR